MTIHSDYVKILKRECPAAFTDTLVPELRPDTVFIDGQVKLMKTDDVKTWTVFLNVMFFKTIERCFDHGAGVVVLGFDDYTYVPKSKTMTQVKRNKTVPDLKFSDADHLPAYMPEDWGAAMRNRTFKVKVIHKILTETRKWFLEKIRLDRSWHTRTLVLDFQKRPLVLFAGGPAVTRETGGDVDTTEVHCGIRRGADLDACLPPIDSGSWRGRGECDVKAFFWMRYSRRLLVVSTDGDFVPLSMLQMLRKQQAQTHAPASTTCDVFLFRLRTKSESTEEPSVKRQRVAQTSTGAPDSTRKKGREYEFVHINKLSACIERLMPSRVQTPVDRFCALIALSGCDFALNLPRLGPRTIWKLRHRLANLDLSQQAQLLCAITILYWDMFIMKNTILTGMTNSTEFFRLLTEGNVQGHYKSVINRIKASKTVSPRITSVLWDTERAYAHSLNIVWTMAYWNLLNKFPDQHSKDYGYILDRKGVTHFAFT
jgi:hypothetical protein